MEWFASEETKPGLFFETRRNQSDPNSEVTLRFSQLVLGYREGFGLYRFAQDPFTGQYVWMNQNDQLVYQPIYWMDLPVDPYFHRRLR